MTHDKWLFPLFVSFFITFYCCLLKLNFATIKISYFYTEIHDRERWHQKCVSYMMYEKRSITHLSVHVKMEIMYHHKIVVHTFHLLETIHQMSAASFGIDNDEFSEHRNSTDVSIVCCIYCGWLMNDDHICCYSTSIHKLNPYDKSNKRLPIIIAPSSLCLAWFLRYFYTSFLSIPQTKRIDMKNISFQMCTNDRIYSEFSLLRDNKWM